MKKIMAIILLCCFSLGVAAQQDTTRKHKNYPRKRKTDTVKRDTFRKDTSRRMPSPKGH